MAKRNSSPPRQHTVSFKISCQELQLICYAASKTSARGLNAWMREQLIDAARARLDGRVVEKILRGEATIPLLRESLAAARRRAKERKAGRIIAFGGKTRR